MFGLMLRKQDAVMLGFVLGDRLGDRLEVLRYLVRALEEERQSYGGVITNPDRLTEMYEDVRTDATETRWCTAVYAGKSIVPGVCGEAYSEFLDQLEEDERTYAYVRFETGDELSRRAKFAFITWIGPRVIPLKKAKVSTDKAFVKSLWSQFGKEILADEKNEVQENKLLQILKSASGAAYGTGQ